MTQSWSIRTSKKDDEQGIIKAMKLNEIERKSEHWFWKYENSPFGHLIGLAEHDGQVIGHMTLIRTYMKIGDKATMGSQAVDLEVNPKFRRQGVFLEIGKFLLKEAGKKGMVITYGFPSKPAHSGHLKYGWFDVCEVPLLIKPINMNKIVNSFDKYKMIKGLIRYRISRIAVISILRGFFTISGFLSRIFNRIEVDDNIENVVIHPIESFDDRIDDFWNEISKDYRIIVIRDRRYLNWRYFRKANVRHKVLLAEENEKILGYIVLVCRNEKNLRVGYIVDVLFSSDRQAVAQSLILAAIDHFKEGNVDLIICWMLKKSSSASMYYKVLRYNGFMNLLGRSHPLIVRINSSGPSETFVRDPANWYITIGDSDHI